MNAETKEFKENVDKWIKKVNNRLGYLESYYSVSEENVHTINHNYELIYELKENIESLRQEIKVMKLMQLLDLKKELENNGQQNN